MSQHSEATETIFQRLRHSPDHEESYRLLYDRFYSPLFRFFGRRGFSTEECKDLIQETFLRVFRGMENFRGEARGELWLFRIAANTAVKYLRRRTAAKRDGREVSLEGEEVVDALSVATTGSLREIEAPEPLLQLLRQERYDFLSQAINALPPQMRRCVRLHVFHDLDYDEIAEILKISPSTVKVQLFKARKRLQRELKFASLTATMSLGSSVTMFKAAAGLLLAVIGLSVGVTITIREERQRLTHLEQRLEEREEALAASWRSLRELAVARARPEREAGRVQELEARVAELTSVLEERRRTPQSPERLASRGIEVSVAPRFVLRGQEAPERGFLRRGLNSMQIPAQANGFTAALDLSAHPAYSGYRFELIDREGQVLWTGRLPDRFLKGNAGTTVTVHGVGPGLYRLRIEGVHRNGTELLAEYVLHVTASPR